MATSALRFVSFFLAVLTSWPGRHDHPGHQQTLWSRRSHASTHHLGHWVSEARDIAATRFSLQWEWIGVIMDTEWMTGEYPRECLILPIFAVRTIVSFVSIVMSWSSPFLSWFVKSDLSCLAHPTFTPECKTIRMNTEQNPIPFTIYRGPCFAATHLDLFDPFDSATGRWCRFGFSGHALRAVRRFHQDAGHVEWESHAENKDEMIKRWQDCGVMWRDLKEPRAWLDSLIKRVLDYIFYCADRRDCHIPMSSKFCFSNIPSLACHLRALRNAILTALSIACSRAQETSGDGKPDVRITQARKWMQMGPSSYTSQIFCGFYPGKTNHPVDPCMVHLRYLPTFWLIFMVNTCRSCK